MLNKLANKIKAKDITTNNIMQKEWFIGSALMGHDFQQLPKGYYYYKQDTIWAKALSVKQINAYWEIYNKTENILLVDPQNDSIQYIFNDLLKELRIQEHLQEQQMIVIADDSWLLDNHIHSLTLSENIPFYMHKKKVGEYIKIFLEKNHIYFPYIDCVQFSINERKYFEINFNYYYKKIMDYVLLNQVPDKISQGMKILNESIFRVEFITEPAYIRLFSLLDVLIELNKQGIQIDARFNGHIAKRILKETCVYLLYLEYDINLIQSYLTKDWFNYMLKENNKIKNIYPKLLEQYTVDILKDRFGMIDSVLEYLTGNMTVESSRHHIQYFTDIPFNTIKNEQHFTKIIKQIVGDKQK